MSVLKQFASFMSDSKNVEQLLMTQLIDDVQHAMDTQPITDLHTHCYSPRFGASKYTAKGVQPNSGQMLLWGIDELVTYHYLVAKVYRVVPASELPYEKFWKMSKPEQADHIWKHLFVENTPLSEACRGVLTTLESLELDPNETSLTPYRKFFAQQEADDYVDRVMEISGVDQITMTNPVFDDHERSLWEKDATLGNDPRFPAVLRIDPLLRAWPEACEKLQQWGYAAHSDFSGKTVAEVQRFLRYWLDRMKAVYVAMSLPPEFRFPDPSNEAGNRFIREILMPVLAERKLPWAMMIGSRLKVNPALRDAGDTVGKADVLAVVNLCAEFPNNKFMVTMLARENQHELCIAARKFSNLMLFGCWWFLNNPSLITEMTTMRMELLGSTFVPQHSDARILDQLIYKWHHSSQLIEQVLIDQYERIADTGFKINKTHIQRDVRLLLRDNYCNFVKR